MNTVAHAAAGVLTGSFTTLYTVPTNKKLLIKAFTVANDTGAGVTLKSQVTFTSGGTARVMVPDRTVGDNATDLVPELINQVVDDGGIIEAQGLNLTYAIAGVLIDA